MKKYLWIVSLALYGLALLSPTYCTSDGCGGFGSGLGLLLIGWLGALGGGIALTWWANPFYIVAISTTKKAPMVSAIFASIGIAIACCFLNGGELLLNEGGQKVYITKIQIGYWFWVGSMVVILFASIFEVVERRKTERISKELNKK